MSIQVARSEGVVTVSLCRPEKLNAMTGDMWSDMHQLLSAIAERNDDCVVVITGTGRAFCAGSDVTEFLSAATLLAERIDATNRALLTLWSLPQPTIARVNGIAAGSGANLALLCDFVVASDRSTFAELFVRRGLSLDSGASWLLPRLIGERRARQMAILGEPVSATQAVEWGLINEVVEERHLDDVVHQLAVKLTSLPRAAVDGTKSLLRESWKWTLGEALVAEAENQLRVVADPATQAEITAFIQKHAKASEW